MAISLSKKRLPVDPRREEFTGKYQITNPEGDLEPYTRATTIAGALDNEWALHRWRLRLAACGFGSREDLWLQCIGTDADDHKDTLDGLVDQALEAAGASVKAGTGTGLHNLTQLLDHGLPMDEMPKKWHLHLQGWLDAIKRSRFELVEAHIEQIVFLDNYRVAGQIDRVLRATRMHRIKIAGGWVTINPGDLVIGDLKTGKLEFSHLKFSVQLAIYAHHSGCWQVDMDADHFGYRRDQLPINLDVALLIHLPAAHEKGKCDLHWVDIRRGFDAFMTALEVTEHRKSPRALLVPWTDEHVPMEVASAAWLKMKAEALGKHPPALVDLQLQWPFRDEAGNPMALPDVPTAEQVVQLTAVIDGIENAHQMPFQPGPPDVELQRGWTDPAALEAAVEADLTEINRDRNGVDE